LEEPIAAFLKRGYRSKALAAVTNAAQSCAVAVFFKNAAIGPNPIAAVKNAAIGQTFSRSYKNAAIALLLRCLSRVWKRGYRKRGYGI